MLIAHLEAGSVAPRDVLVERLGAAAANFPLMASRMHGKWWIPSSIPDVFVAEAGVSPLEIAPIGPFDLAEESPVRVVTASDGNWLMLCAHHFAIDGLGMVSLLRALLTGRPGSLPGYRVRNSPGHPATHSLQRLIRPADPIAPSAIAPSSESFAATDVLLSGPNFTARLSRASVEAVREHNHTRSRPLRRIGLSIAVGGVDTDAATYRRVDLSPGQDAEAAVIEALADPAVPAEIKGLPPGAFLLRPLLNRFSDTILVSNLGRLDLESVTRVEFYPVARGRSAVSVGAAGLAGKRVTLTLRARNLDSDDTASLLERIAVSLERTIQD